MKQFEQAVRSILKVICPVVSVTQRGVFFALLFAAVLAAGCSSGSDPEPAPSNTAPVVAKTGPIIGVRVGETPVLDGSKSFTAYATPLSYEWSFSHKPDNSDATLHGATSENPSFVADVKGVYMVQLVVSANGTSSKRAIQTVIVTKAPERLTGSFNHVGLSSSCVQCHSLTLPENTWATPVKTPNHLGTSNVCQACHTPQGAAIIPFTDHLEVFGNCSECHDGVTAVGKSEFHTVTSAECDECHNTTSFLELGTDGKFDHSNITRSCSGCHNGTVAIGKTATPDDTPPGTHPVTNTECGYCHVTTAFLPAYPDHTDPSFVDNCTSCHNGTTANAEPAGHPVMNVECDSCHSIISFDMGGVFNHGLLDPTIQPCESCHNDNNSINARGKASDPTPPHPTTSSDCGSCHTTESFLPAFGVDHSTLDPATRCDSCHNGIDATGIPLTTLFYEHMPLDIITGTIDEDCKLCHSPGTFTTGSYDHSGSVYSCTACHNNTITVGKLPNHIPTTPDNQECDACHTTTAFVPATFDHTGIVDSCVSCHDGTISSGKSGNHLPTDQDCSVCHTTTTIGSSAAPFKDTAFNHTGITGNCESCHSGNPDHVALGAIGKAQNHIPALNVCVDCHIDTFAGGFASAATFMANVHTSYNQGCEGCHVSKFLPTANGTQNVIKPASHLPTVQDCYLCHTITAFTPSIFAHTDITGNCETCHDGSTNNVLAGALGKAQATNPHPVTTADCGACHAVGSNFTDGTFDHTGIVNNCASCHGDNPTATPVGPMKHVGHLPTTQDCSVCHVPGTFLNAVFDHTGIVDNCASCHNGSNATGMPTVPQDHPDPLGKDCSACHNTTAFIGASYDHTGIVDGCANCHDGVTARGKTPPPNHVPTNNDCSNCHQTTGFLPVTFSHAGIVDNCSSCHDAGFATGKHATHVPTSQDCGVCHNTSSFTGAVFDHTGVVNNCASCHDGNTAIGMDAKTNPVHWPTSRDCSDCHTTATFLSGTWIHEANSAGQCDSCHSLAGGARTKPAGHLSTTSQCDVCHSTNGWVPSNFSHDPNGNYPGDHRKQLTCSECHGATISATIPYPFPAYAPDCAACHANEFEPKDKHIGGESGTVQQNRDCASAGCHSVRDDEF